MRDFDFSIILSSSLFCMCPYQQLNVCFFVFVNNKWVIKKKMGQDIPLILRNSGYVMEKETITF